jgi:hypothetical protein
MIAVDTLWTGVSGVFIFILIAWACIRIIGGRK